MSSAIIDGATIRSPDDLHDVLAAVLELPPYYGRNLDALWDCLTGWIEPPVEVVWREFALSRERLGAYADRTLEVLRRAAGEVEGLTVRVEE
ncbi:MAG: barstar family protein [Deltaproteobacteria bacterium]|nr:barstar family protein [Deltaproteobacteria bacterium]